MCFTELVFLVLVSAALLSYLHLEDGLFWRRIVYLVSTSKVDMLAKGAISETRQEKTECGLWAGASA